MHLRRLAGSLLLSFFAGCPASPVPMDAPVGADDVPIRTDGAVDGGPIDGGPVDGGPIDGGAVSTTPIGAAAGGTAISTDGRFFLFVPPGALSADTEITIRVLPAGERPAEASGAVSEVYEVLPEGLTFAVPATAITYYPTAPPGFQTDDGALSFTHQSRSASGVVEAVPTITVAPMPGAAASFAELDHLSSHWVDIFTPPRVRGVIPTGVHRVGELFVGEVALFREVDTGTGYVVDVRNGIATVTGESNVRPIGALDSFFESLTYFDWFVLDARTELRMLRAARIIENRSLDVPVGESVTLTPRPGWRCDGVDVGTLIFVDVDSADSAIVQFGRRLEAFVSCSDGAAILLADSQRVVASPAGPTLSGGGGVAANVIVPDRSTLDTFTVVGGATIAEGTTFRSELGPPSVTLTSSLQTVTATHDGARYALTGLAPAAAFDASDTLTVTASTTSGPVSVPVSAPAPITSASDLLDPPSGLTSTISWPDGACDAFVVQATLAGSVLPGDAQIIRRVACDEAPLEGGRRRIRIVEDAMLSELADRGLTIAEITVGAVNEADCSAIFPALGDVPCQAGRLLRFSTSALEPFDPGPCGDPVSFPGNVDVRWASDTGACDVIRTGEPGAMGIDIGRIDTRTGGSVWRYTITSTSHGTVSGMRIDGIPFGTDVTVVLATPTGITLTVTFRLDGDTLSVSDFEQR